MDQKIIDVVRELIEPIIEEQNLELVEIKYIPGGKRGSILRIVIDKENGVTLGDCTRVSKEVGYILEIKDVIPHSYQLEVSSPGLERPLRTLKDFEKFCGKKVSIITSQPLNGQRHFRGTIKLIQNGNVHLDIKGKYWKIPFKIISKARSIFEFPQKN